MARARMILAALLSLICGVTLGAEAYNPLKYHDHALNRAQIGTNTASLVAFLRQRSAPDAVLARLPQVIRQLVSPLQVERRQAVDAIRDIGPVAWLELQRAGGDPEVNAVARLRAAQLRPAADVLLTTSAMQILLTRAPDAAVPALFGYLPSASDGDQEALIWTGLDALVSRAPARAKACREWVKDQLPARRALAAYLLARYGDAADRSHALKCLDDAVPAVRLRACQGLLGSGDKRGIPVLIELLSELTLEQAWEAEELLRWAAGVNSPEALLASGGVADRTGCCSAWRRWWREQEATLDLARVIRDEWRRPGLLLMLDTGTADRAGSAWLTGCDGTTRCLLTNLAAPVDAQLLPGARFLLAESKHGVTERDADGHILWETTEIAEPQSCRRMADGSVRIADRLKSVAVEWDSQRDALWQPEPLGGLDYRGAIFLPDGTVNTVEAQLNMVFKITRYAPVEKSQISSLDWIELRGRTQGVRYLDELDNGHFLVAASSTDCVIEFNRGGWTVWDYIASDCRRAIRLRNGNTLVAGGGRLREVGQNYHVIRELYFERNIDNAMPCLPLVGLGFDACGTKDRDLVHSQDYWRSLLASKQVWRVLHAVHYLGEEGPALDFSMALVIALLDSPDLKLREAAAIAQKNIRSDVTVPIRKRLTDSNPKERIQAIWDLGHYNRHGAVVVPAMLTMLKDSDPEVRGMAANMLGCMSLDKPVVIPAVPD